MNKSRSPVLAGLLIIAFLAGVTIWKAWKKGPPRPSAAHSLVDAKVSYEERIQRDREILKKDDATDPEVFGAVVRLAQRRDPEARVEALRRARSTSGLVREGVANGLGFYDDPEALAVLQAMMRDPEPKVRVQAIGALARVATEERQKLLRAVLERKDLREDERLAALRGLVKIAHAPEERDRAIQDLVRYARATKEPRALEQSVMSAIALAPTSPETMSLLREKLTAVRSPGIVAAMIRHLASRDDPWLKSNVSRLQSSNELSIRLATVQTIHLTCPANRWDFISKTLADKDPAISLAAQQALFFMDPPRAQKLLTDAIEAHKLPSGSEERARRLLENLRKNTAPDRCQSPDASRTR